MSLHLPSRTGDLSALRHQIAGGASLEARDENGHTPLMVAAESGQVEAVRVLLEAGALPDAATEPRELARDETPIGPPEQVSTRYGLLELIAPIVGGQSPVKRKRTTTDGPTALILASAFGHASIVKALLEAGATLDAPDRDGFTALSYASALGRAKVVRILLNAGAEINLIDHYKMTPVILAALFGHAETVRVLGDAGANLSATDRFSLGALHAAAYYNHAEAARVLVSLGADPNETVYNQTPLQMALGKYHAQVVAVLAPSENASLNTFDTRTLTPLMNAISTRDLPSVKSLLDAGADPNVTVRGDDEPFSSQSLPDGASALHLAACLEDPAFVSALIAAGALIQAHDSLGFSPLMLATASGHSETAKTLRMAGPPPNSDQETLLAFELVAAVRLGDLNRVRGLLAEGTAPDVKIPNTFKYHYLLRCEAARDDWDVALNIGDTEGEGSFKDAERPVLSLAIELGHDAIAQALIEAGASPETRAAGLLGNSGRTPLFEAAEHGRLELVRPLILAGADVNARDARDYTPLMLSARGGHADVARDLIRAGADVNAKTWEKETPLSIAIEKSHVDMIRVLLNAGARPQPGDPSHAALTGDVECTRLLLDACRKHRVTPANDTLSHAIFSKSKKLVQMLIDAGIDVNIESSPDGPPLMTACQAPFDLFQILIDAGADVNARDSQGSSALSRAVMFGSPDHVRLLLDHGADPNARTQDGDRAGQTALIQVAGSGLRLLFNVLNDPEQTDRLQSRDESLLRLLLDHGASVNAQDRHGRTALMHAAEKGQDSFVRILLDAGADVRMTDTRHGRSALHWAAVGGNEATVRLLLDAGADRVAEDLDGFSPHALARKQAWPKIEPLLTIDPDEASSHPSSTWSFRNAVLSGDLPALLESLSAGVDADTLLSEGRTGLTIASEAGQTRLVRALLDAGADPNVVDGEERTPLLLAIESGNLEIVQALLDSGADPNLTGRMHGGDPTTPLLFSITEHGISTRQNQAIPPNESVDASPHQDPHLEILRALIKAGADLDAEDDLGIRPLWYAMDTREDEMANLLIEAGAGQDAISTVYKKARTMPDRATSEAFLAVVRELGSLCGSEPQPLTDRASPSQWFSARTGGRLPTGPTIGALFSVTRESAEALVASHQDVFRARGAFLVLNSQYTGKFDYARPLLGLLAAEDWETVLAAICSPGNDWGWVCPAFYIRDLRALEPEYPFRLIACESRSLELEFQTPIANPDDLAQRLDSIRTHLAGAGLPEYPGVEDMAEHLQHNPRITFHWE